MSVRELASRIVAWLRVIRREVAPPGSSREKVAQLLYVPLINSLPPQKRLRILAGDNIAPRVVHFEDVNIKNLRCVSIKKVIVFKLDHIGDFIVGMPAMRTLRDGFPNAHITLVCGSWNETWARSLNWFDRVVRFDFFTELNRNWNPTPSMLMELYGKVERLPLGEYDLAIDLRHDVETRNCLYRIKAIYRVGFEAPVEIGMPYLDLVLPNTEAIPAGSNLSRSLHAELRLQMLAATAVRAFTSRPPHPVRALVPVGVSVKRPFAVLAIGAGDPIRYWPIDRYAVVGHELISRYGLDIVILCGGAEQNDAACLAALLPSARTRTVINEPLSSLPELLAAATLCVGNGSAMSHLAAALGTATVCILGGTTRMDVWHPTGANAISIGGWTPCQPCGLKRGHDCPWDVACLGAVSAADVLKACDRLMISAVLAEHEE